MGSEMCIRDRGVWIERRPMPGRAGPIEKSKENLRFFNIFSLEASKTNGFSTFWLRKLQKPKDFQWFWGQAGPGRGPGQARGWAGADRARPAADGARPRASGAKLDQTERLGQARQASLWSRKAPQTTGWGNRDNWLTQLGVWQGSCHCVGGEGTQRTNEVVQTSIQPTS